MKEIINPLATVELIAPLVQLLLDYYGDEAKEDEYHEILCTLHQLLFPSIWREPFTNSQVVEMAKSYGRDL